MPARVVVILGCLMQRKGQIVVGTDPFGGVDSAGLQGGKNLAAGQDHGNTAGPGKHFSADTGYAHAQPLQVFDGVDFFVEPAGHLHARVTCGEGHQIKLAVQFPPKGHAATVVQPAIHLLGVHTKWHGSEHGRCWVFTSPVIGCTVPHLSGALRDCIKNFQGRHQFASTVYLDVQTTVAHHPKAVSQPLWRGTKTG